MANWILFARDASGKPIVSAMNGGTVEESLNSDSKDNLIGFLKRFSGAGTFLVAKADGSNNEVEAVELLPQSDPSASNEAKETLRATWFQFFRNGDGQPIVVAMNGTNGVESYKGNLRQTLIDFLVTHSGANTFQVAPVGTSIPQGIPEWKRVPSDTKLWLKNRVMLEIGHGPGVPFDPGAIAHDNKTTEHELNVIAANAARKVLVGAGVDCIVIDTPQGSLYDIGLQASRFDVFCSIHHNSFNQAAQGSEALVHKDKADAPDRKLAEIMAKEMSSELGINNRGVNDKRNLGILSGAEDTNVRASVLAEIYFMDVPNIPLKDYSTRGGEAVGRAIVNWLEKNPR